MNDKEDLNQELQMEEESILTSSQNLPYSDLSTKSGTAYANSCRRQHPGGKDIDLAELESKAFKFMVLQKPY